MRGMFITLPSGNTPSAASVPSSAEATAPIVPSPPAATTTSMPSCTARRRLASGSPYVDRLHDIAAEAVPLEQHDQLVTRYCVRGDALLRARVRIADDAVAELRRRLVGARWPSWTDLGAMRLDPAIQRRERHHVARAEQVRGRHVGEPVMALLDAARPHERDQPDEGPNDRPAKQNRSHEHPGQVGGEPVQPDVRQTRARKGSSTRRAARPRPAGSPRRPGAAGGSPP